MKSSVQAAAVAAIVLCAGACSPAGSGQAAGGGGLSEVECRAVLGKAREMLNIPADVLSEAMEAELRTCADKGTLSQEEYDCGMAATTAQEWAACRIDITS